MNRLFRWFSKRAKGGRRNPAEYSFWAGVAVLSCVAIAGVLAVRLPSSSEPITFTKASSRSAGSDPVSSTLARYVSNSDGSYTLTAPEEHSDAWSYGLYAMTGIVALLIVVYIVRRQSSRIARWQTRRKLHSMIQPDDLSASFARLRSAPAPKPGGLQPLLTDEDAEIGVMPIVAVKNNSSSFHIDATFDVDQAYIPDEPQSL